MSFATDPQATCWSDALLASRLTSISPVQLKGVCVRAPAGPVRELWMDCLQRALPGSKRARRVPLSVSNEALHGGINLAATLTVGRKVDQIGLLASADGGVIVLPMAERWSAHAIAGLTCVMDTGSVGAIDRRTACSAQFVLVALDEGDVAEERPPQALLDRLAFHIELGTLRTADCDLDAQTEASLDHARKRVGDVQIPDGVVDSLVAAAANLGVDSARAALFAVWTARAHAALSGRNVVGESDAIVAARLVLVPRARHLARSLMEEEESSHTAQPEPDHQEPRAALSPNEQQSEPSERLDSNRREIDQMQDSLLAATLATLPPRMLEDLEEKLKTSGMARGSGRGPTRQQARRGRPIGSTRGDPRRNRRVDIAATILAAAPWQALRRRHQPNAASSSSRSSRVIIRPDDLRVPRYKHQPAMTTIFAVDASGSSALHRLAEAKGAIELLLADCYVRRDRVALIAFRGSRSEILLSPTRSLTRARRALSALPGGGTTPLASGIDQAHVLSQSVMRTGQSSLLVFLTDGCANVDRSGKGGRKAAAADALTAAHLVRAARMTSLLIDTSPRPQPLASQLADAMGARYIPLPYADARGIAHVVQQYSKPSQC